MATSVDETSSAIAGADTAREIESVNPFDLMLGEVHSAVSEDTAWGVESANPFVLGVREFGQMIHSERLGQRLATSMGERAKRHRHCGRTKVWRTVVVVAVCVEGRDALAWARDVCGALRGDESLAGWCFSEHEHGMTLTCMPSHKFANNGHERDHVRAKANMV